jgi:hypothetical protein
MTLPKQRKKPSPKLAKPENPAEHAKPKLYENNYPHLDSFRRRIYWAIKCAGMPINSTQFIREAYTTQDREKVKQIASKYGVRFYAFFLPLLYII